MMFCFNLKISPLCQTLSGGLFYQGMTLSNAVVHLFLRKLLLISYPLSKDVKISLLIDNSWLAQESRDLKPIWFLEIRLFLIVTAYRERRNWTIIFNILLNTFRELEQHSNFYHVNTFVIMAIGFVWIEIINNFFNIFSWKCNCKCLSVTPLTSERNELFFRITKSCLEKEEFKS